MTNNLILLYKCLSMKKIYLLIIIVSFLFNCSIVTLPYKAAKTSYKATKTVVKGAAAVGDALIPDKK